MSDRDAATNVLAETCLESGAEALSDVPLGTSAEVIADTTSAAAGELTSPDTTVETEFSLNGSRALGHEFPLDQSWAEDWLESDGDATSEFDAIGYEAFRREITASMRRGHYVYRDEKAEWDLERRRILIESGKPRSLLERYKLAFYHDWAYALATGYRQVRKPLGLPTVAADILEHFVGRSGTTFPVTSSWVLQSAAWSAAFERLEERLWKAADDYVRNGNVDPVSIDSQWALVSAARDGFDESWGNMSINQDHFLAANHALIRVYGVFTFTSTTQGVRAASTAQYEFRDFYRFEDRGGIDSRMFELQRAAYAVPFVIRADWTKRLDYSLIAGFTPSDRPADEDPG